jgi:hypothetical protein
LPDLLEVVNLPDRFRSLSHSSQVLGWTGKRTGVSSVGLPSGKLDFSKERLQIVQLSAAQHFLRQFSENPLI